MVVEAPVEPSLIGEHDTWISLDPVIGCPADCGYCYLGTLNLRATKPRLRISPDRAAEALRAYLHGRRSRLIDPFDDSTPICIGNYTDMFMTAHNRSIMLRILERLTDVIPPRPVVLITKAAISETMVAELDAFGWPIVWFFSQSFARDRGVGLERGRIADFGITLANARAVSASRHQHAVHFWRPFVRELSPPAPDRARMVGRLKDAGMRCSVVVGMKRGPGVPAQDGRLRAHVRSGIEEEPDRGEVLDREGWREVVGAARRVDYPIYRHSSCAIALIRRRAEQLGTWRTDLFPDRCIPCSCPGAQRRQCGRRSAGRDGTEAAAVFAEQIANFLELNGDLVSCDGVSGYLYIDAPVSEFDYNVILHASMGRYVPVAQSVVGQKAWQGPLASKKVAKDDIQPSVN